MDFIQAVNKEGIPIFTDISCKTLTSFKIGGKADYLIEPSDTKQLVKTLSLVKQYGIKYILIGCGSNLLFSDNGYRGAIIRLKPPFSSKAILPGNQIKVYAGERLSSLCNFALENSLSGLEFCYGIPGSVGGAVYMNAGAYGGEITDIFLSAEILTEDLTLELRNKEQMDFSYRHSALCSNNEILISTTLQLMPDCTDKIKDRMNELMSRRVDKQPLSLPSAGSTFKRPTGGYASALIDECGLKGFTVGGASVSEKHAGFVVNNGGASCNDILTLCDKISEIVYAKKGILLETEVEIVKE